MSILIKGMKMPIGCLSCPLASGYYIEDTKKDEWVSVRCRVLNKKMQVKGVPNDCPLVELPDHGDLIDSNMLIGGFADWYIQESPMYLGDNNVVAETIGEAMRAIEAAHVVIPAERSEDDG